MQILMIVIAEECINNPLNLNWNNWNNYVHYIPQDLIEIINIFNSKYKEFGCS